ncbi:MAG TPA: hypothetical protein VF274_01385 [Alphaproteobacteria bacterium]|jgi:hypothetical protein
MKRPSRELNIFSISALDLFASAMGAFILIAVILFPYYQQNSKILQELEETRTRAEIAEGRAKAAEEESRRAQAAAQAAERRASAAEQRAQAAERQAQQAEARAKAAEAKVQGPMRLPGGDPNARSLAFAKGCWRTDPFQHSPQQRPGISQYCFDENGRGNLFFWRERAETCAAFATLRREGDVIRIDDSDSRCQIGQRDVGPWYADHLVCRPDANGVVICEGHSQMAQWRVRLHRQ